MNLHSTDTQTVVKQLNLCMQQTQTAQHCLNVEGTPSALCLLSHLCSQKTILCSLPSFTIHAPFFICSERRADILHPYFSAQSHKEMATDTDSRETSKAGYQAPSSIWRIDYRCQYTQILPGFIALQENVLRLDFVPFFPTKLKKNLSGWKFYLDSVHLLCAESGCLKTPKPITYRQCLCGWITSCVLCPYRHKTKASCLSLPQCVFVSTLLYQTVDITKVLHSITGGALNIILVI